MFCKHDIMSPCPVSMLRLMNHDIVELKVQQIHFELHSIPIMWHLIPLPDSTLVLLVTLPLATYKQGNPVRQVHLNYGIWLTNCPFQRMQRSKCNKQEFIIPEALNPPFQFICQVIEFWYRKCVCALNWRRGKVRATPLLLLQWVLNRWSPPATKLLD